MIFVLIFLLAGGGFAWHSLPLYWASIGVTLLMVAAMLLSPRER